MKNNFRLFVFMAIFSLSLFFPALNAGQELPFPNPDISISMDFQNASLKDILKIFSIQSGLNFIASEAVKDRTFTLYFDKVPIKEAMDKIFKANNLSYELDADSNIFIVKDWGTPQVETVTKVFYLKHATVSSSSLKEEMGNYIKQESSFALGGGGGTSSSGGTGSSGGAGGTSGKWRVADDTGITTAVKKLLSEHGSVIEDFRTNSLIVTDIPMRMAVVAQVIASLDIPSPQVMLEVEMLDVSKNVVDRLGISYGTTPFTAIITGAAASSHFPFGNWARIFEPGSGNIAINTGANTYTMALDFLRSQTDTRFLARPRLLTLNNETAEIRIATSESVGIKTTTTGTGGTSEISSEAERAETGVILRITPQINPETGEVTMFIYPKVAEATAGNTLESGGSDFQYRDPEERSTKSMVRVKDGDTVIIGGLIRNEFLRQTTKLPFLGDLPLIGALFRHIGGTSSSPDKNKQRELLIFITPHIVKDKGIELAQAKPLPKFPEREQGAFSAVDRQAVIKDSLDSFEKK